MNIKDFDLEKKKGDLITLITKDHVKKRGFLLGVTPDKMLLLEFYTDVAVAGIMETACDDILEIF